MSLGVDVERTFLARGADPFAVDVTLSVDTGETVVVLGPSGSGKSLLLETVGGFHEHEGSITLDGTPVTDVPPEDRGFGFVFQEYALFPHMSVRENVAFGARYHEETRDPDRMLAELGVGDLADRRPNTLSGGERQRVALARSLAIDPAALLLDEPLSALDVPTRRSLREDLSDVLSDRTALYVTHDRTTARAIGDRVAVMRDGTVEQVGSPETVFERPTSAFVARFTGANCLRASHLGGTGTVPASVDAALLAIRPEHVHLSQSSGQANGTVQRVVREEATYRVQVRLGDAVVDAFESDPPAPGDRVDVELPGEYVGGLEDA